MVSMSSKNPKRGLTPSQVRSFRRTVRNFYLKHGRKLPWRETKNPYKIVVSEFMLQQTQVPRVLEKYQAFIRVFPDVESLKRAPLRSVLGLWQGLGYNRRAQALKKTAERIVDDFKGSVPSEIESLMELPGIGHATACSIRAFAYNKPVVFIETNIRTVFIHHFFKKSEEVHDRDLLPLIARTLDRRNPRTWYYALMDYGVFLKKEYGNLNTKSAHYKRQERFKGSNREVRGAILRALVKEGRIREKDLCRHVQFKKEKVLYNMEQLANEGLVVRDGDLFFISE